MRRPSLVPGPGRARWPRRLALLALVPVLAACDNDWSRFGYPNPITRQGDRLLNIYRGSFWAALGVGAVVYALILWSCFRYRKRGDSLPRQVHYNLPVEVIYTVMPFVIVAVFFYYTVRDETYVDRLSTKPDVTVGVVGFQWSWQFNYAKEKLQVTGRPGQFPTLVLPVNKRVRFIETSPDVIHAFWVPEFIFKRDVIPGRANQFEIRPDRVGTFAGRCTELCGVYHDRMLFTLKVVSQAEYNRFITTAKAAAAAGTSDIYTTSAAAGSSP